MKRRRDPFHHTRWSGVWAAREAPVIAVADPTADRVDDVAEHVLLGTETDPASPALSPTDRPGRALTGQHGS